jgi:multidrug efflux pump
MDCKFFINRPRFAFVISIVIILVGLIAMKGLPLEEYPTITPPQVTVSATYMGASSDVLNQLLLLLSNLQLMGLRECYI